MTDSELSRADLVKRMTGRWSGSESILADDGSGKWMEALGEFENVPALGGTGIATDYRQSVDGKPTFRCHALLRFADDDTVTMTWMPTSGEPLIFEGTRDGAAFKLVRVNGSGDRQEMSFDYGSEGEMRFRTTSLPDGETGNNRDNGVDLVRCTYRELGPVVGRMTWRDLTVDDAVQARDFYAAVIGWTWEAVDMGDREDFSMLDETGEVAAGVCHALGGIADFPPVWLPYFQVASVDDAISQALGRGGKVAVEAKGWGNFRYVVLADPAGAHFVACEGRA